MRWAERTSRWLRRSEVRTALAAVAAIFLLLSLQVGVLWLYVRGEYTQEAESRMAAVCRLLEAAIATAGVGDLQRIVGNVVRHEADLGLAARWRLADGTIREEWGTWPREGSVFDPEGQEVRAGLRLRRGFHLSGRVAVPGRGELELALPLAHYADEADEVRTGLQTILTVSLALGALIVLLATRVAFGPLRRGTRALHSLEPGRLGVRLPVRGTGDYIDQHALALNRSLDELEAGFQRLRAFTSDAAHELRTPVNRIWNAADLALLEGGTSAAARDALEVVRRTSEEVARLLDGLLLLARLDEGAEVLESEPIAAAKWLAELGDLYAPLCSERGIDLQIESDDSQLSGDRRLLDRALCNLLDNAILHGARSGGTIRLAAQREGTGVALSVEDSGPGIPEAERERVFDRFARLGHGRAARGFGIGLALARAIAEAHGGWLRADASALGGARFILRL